jgi:hypothetical protein
MNRSFVGANLARWVGISWLAILVVAPATQASTVDQEVLYRIDFSRQPDGEAAQWLTEQGFDFQLDAGRLDPEFRDGRLILQTERERAGMFLRELDLSGVESIRVTWGVERYPRGVDWDNGVFRVPIAVMISFGREQLPSGSLFLPRAPHFIGLFLDETAQEGRAYTATYYQQGGRYFCSPCGAPAGETVTTQFNLEEAFRKAFDGTSPPPITAFGFQMNTKNTDGVARAFLETVEFLSQ